MRVDIMVCNKSWNLGLGLSCMDTPPNLITSKRATLTSSCDIAHHFDGVFISNGPGDPTYCTETVHTREYPHL